jgi:ParB family chromosome partitioning protein
MGMFMVEQRKALGKGLGSLIPVGNRADGASKVYFECQLTDIIPNPKQPRKLFAKESIDELAASIEEKGVLQPLIVRRFGGGKYELIAGERRFRAAQQIGLNTVPVVIKDVDENETLELALVENIQRQDLNPIEEALAYKELLGRYQYTQDELAKHIGKDRSSIANSLRLLKLSDKIRDYLISGDLTMGHARALLGLENRELQLQIADDIVKNNLSVREVEMLIKKFKESGGDRLISVPEDTGGSQPRPANRYGTIESRLKEQLRTMIKIRTNGKKGQLIISFMDDSHLNTLADKLLS